MVTIPLAFYLVMIELAIGSFLVLFALDVRNDTSINFVRFQGVLYLLLFTLLAWGTLNGFANTGLLQGSHLHLDYGWLRLQGPLLLWFMLLQIPYNLLVVITPKAPQSDGEGFSPENIRRLRWLRLACGAAVCAVGLADLLAVGMGYRGIAAGVLGGAPTVLAFMAGALSLGGVSTAMLLGHWYLNTPTASGKPLEFATSLTIIGIVAQIVFGVLGGASTYVKSPAAVTIAPPQTVVQVAPHPVIQRIILPQTIAAPTPAPTPSVPSPVPSGVKFNNAILAVLEYLLGFGLPLGLSIIALYLERGRSFQSATGMLYIAVVFAFFGEILARSLFLQPLL